MPSEAASITIPIAWICSLLHKPSAQPAINRLSSYTYNIEQDLNDRRHFSQGVSSYIKSLLLADMSLWVLKIAF